MENPAEPVAGTSGSIRIGEGGQSVRNGGRKRKMIEDRAVAVDLQSQDLHPRVIEINERDANGILRSRSVRVGCQNTEICCLLKATDQNRGDVSRAVLEILAQDAELDRLQVYRSFLDVCFSTSLDYSQFDDLEDEEVELLYGGNGSECRRPYFMDLMGSSSHRHALEEAVGRQLVLLQREGKDGKVTVMHDCRALTLSSRWRALDLEMSRGTSETPSTAILLESYFEDESRAGRERRRLFKVWQCRKGARPVLLIEEKQYLSNSKVVDTFLPVTATTTFFHVVNAILAGPPGSPITGVMRKPRSYFPRQDEETLMEAITVVESPRRLFLEHDSRQNTLFRDDPDRPNFLLVVYTGRDATSCKRPRREHFEILAHVYDWENPDADRGRLLHKTRILGVSCGRFVYEITDPILVEDLRLGEKQNFITLSREDLGVPRTTTRPGGGTTTPDGRTLRKKYNRRSGRYQTEHANRWNFGCPCLVCQATPGWSKNMLGRTPSGRYQFPMIYNLSLEDFVRVLGLGEEVLERVRLASKMSLASYDLESVNRQICQDVGEQSLTQRAMRMRVSDRCAPRKILSRQSILLIGYTDALSRAEGQDVVILDVRDHNDSTNALVGRFLELLQERRKAAVRYKADLLNDLTTWVRAHGRRHWDYHVRETPLVTPLPSTSDKTDWEKLELESKSNRLWRQSFLGKFETALNMLIRKFVVSAFNASGYDLVMLCKKLVRCSYVSAGGGLLRTSEENDLRGESQNEDDDDEDDDDGEEDEPDEEEEEETTNIGESTTKRKKKKNTTGQRRKRIKINRQGNDISSMQIGDITFQDTRRLVAPGASLASVAKMCGSGARLRSDEGSKGIFPFGKMTSSAYLDEPRLPSDPEEWRSDIAAKSPNAEEVGQALDLFEKRGFRNVGDYLVHYLRIDVLLLQDCSESLFDMMTKVQEVNFVDRNAYTAASVSHASSNGYLLRNHRVGMYATSDARIFSVSLISLKHT